MTGKKFVDHPAPLLAKFEEIVMPSARHNVEFGSRNTLRKQRGVGGRIDHILAAVNDERWRFDGGQEVPGVMPFACKVMEPLRIGRERMKSSFTHPLEIVRMRRNPGG